MATTSTATVSPEMAHVLHQYITPVTNNKRRILVTALDTPRNRNQIQPPLGRNFSSQTITPRDFVSNYQTKVVDHIEIPAMLYSKETYEFMGFVSEKAQELWDIFCDPYAPRTFLETAVGHINDSELEDCTSRDQDWDWTMKELGFDEELRTSMLDSMNGDIRFTNSLKWWLKMCVEDRYCSLLDIDDRLRQESPRLVGQNRVSTTPSGPHVSRKEGSQPSFDSSSQAPGGLFWADGAQDRTIPTPSRAFMQVPVDSTVPDAPKHRAGYMTLWRGALSWRINRLYNKRTGKVDLQSNSSCPGDFSGDRFVTYWSPEKETADQYVGFCRKLNKKANYSVLQLYVPRAWINSLRDVDFADPASSIGAPVQNWYKVVHACRNARFWPQQFASIYEKLELAKGPILNGGNTMYHAEGSQWSDLRARNCLFIEREEDHRTVHAQQWVFYGQKITDTFNQKCHGQGRVHYLGRMAIAAARD